MAQSNRPLLVTGASGHLGRRVVELLLERGEKNIIATTRNPAKLSDLAAKGVTVRAADFDDQASLVTAFTGAERVLLISTDALDRPGRRLEQHLNAVAAAAKAGVTHVVYTSLFHPDPDSAVTIAPDHWGTEQALAKSALSWTVLRNSLYTDYLIPSLARAVATGEHVTATGTGGTAYVTREDCARAAAAALASTDTSNKTYDVTGPTVVTQAELAKLASEQTGKPVKNIAVPADGLRAGLTGAGLPAGLVDLLVSFDVAIANGEYASTSTAVKELTGSNPTAPKDFLTREVLLSPGA